MDFEITTLSSKGQVVIPRNVRDVLGFGVGTKLAIFTDGQKVLLQPISKPNVSAFRKLQKRSEQAKTKAQSGKKRKAR